MSRPTAVALNLYAGPKARARVEVARLLLDANRAGRVRATIGRASDFERPFVADHAKFARTFGASPTPHRDAIRTTLAWWRANA